MTLSTDKKVWRGWACDRGEHCYVAWDRQLAEESAKRDDREKVFECVVCYAEHYDALLERLEAAERKRKETKSCK